MRDNVLSQVIAGGGVGEERAYSSFCKPEYPSGVNGAD